MKFVVQGWEAYVSNKKDSALPGNAHGKTRQVNIMNEALGQLNAMTALFRLHVRERDMDPEEIATLIHAEEFSQEMQQSNERNMTLYNDGEYARAVHWLNEDLEELCKKHNLVQTPEELASIMETCDSKGLFDDAVDTLYDEIERIAVSIAKDKKDA